MAASSCRRARFLARKAGEGLRPLGRLRGAASMLAFNLGAGSGVCPRRRFLPGHGESWTKAGWFVFKAFGPEEESASPLSAHGASPALQTTSPAFLVGTGPGPFTWGSWVLVHLLIPWFLSVQAEVLDEEDNIEEDGEDAESKLGRVSKDQGPLVCEQPEGTEPSFRMADPEAAGACGATGRVCVCVGVLPCPGSHKPSSCNAPR